MAAPSAVKMYAENLSILSLTDLAAATVKFALVTSSYTPDDDESGDDLWSHVSANEIANGNGYTTGGATVANDLVTAITNGYKYSSDNVLWTASGTGIPAWRYAVMYILGTQWTKVNPLICYFIGDSAPANIPLTAAGNPLQLNCPAAGWFTVVKT
jgi:hypothetical protein